MTDTMREWYNKRFANRNPDLCEHGYEDMLEAWQAAQADARALVGELVEAIDCWDNAQNAFPSERAAAIRGAVRKGNKAKAKAQAFMEGK